MTRAPIPPQVPAPRNRELLGASPARAVVAVQGDPPGWKSARTALRAIASQVLLRPARIGTLAGIGAMIAIVVMRGSEWWILLGVLLFQVTAAAFTAMWVDFRPARQVRPAPTLALEPPGYLHVFLPRPRHPWHDQ